MNSIDTLQPFGEPDCESDVTILGEDQYRKYYFQPTYFSQKSLDPSVYLIVGRRGAGKTALTNFFYFQKKIPNATIVNIDEPAAFHEVLAKIAEQSYLNRDLQSPKLVKIWEYVIWLAIFQEFSDRDPRIALMTRVSGEEGLPKIGRSILIALLEKYIGTGDDLVDEVGKVFHSKVFLEAQAAVLKIAKTSPIIITVDTLEKYSINDEMLMTAVAALVEFSAQFCRQYAAKNLFIKVFVMDEIFPYLREEYISNTTKYVKNEIYLHWRPKVLMQMMCWRLYQYLRLRGWTALKLRSVDWHSHRDVKHKIWLPYFGKRLNAHRNVSEKVFPYILRHTHLRPRQLIVLCNAIAARAIERGEFPQFSTEAITCGIRDAINDLANEIFNAYSCVYPNASRIADALSGIQPVFRANELDKRAPQTASQWLDNNYSPYQFRQFVAELGIVGRVRHLDESTGIVKADFEYFMNDRLVLSTDDLCVIHPMFYRKLNIPVRADRHIYPFPDHEDFMHLSEFSSMGNFISGALK
ncbi:MAG: hypothetical protein AAF329_25965 [Cyanobacteria bacterium P01_A01_bin.17]